jgi:Cutinase
MGSGQAEEYEKEHKTNKIPTTGPAAESVSPETDTVYKAMNSQLEAEGSKLTQTFYQLPYSAPSVSVLVSGLTKPSSVIGAGKVIGADWDRLVNVNMVKYIAGELQGESELYAYLTQIYNNCHQAGQQPMVVLAGYSQGAMVVHNVLNAIAASSQAGLSSMIKGAALIADPERMPKSDITNFGTAAWGDYGVCHTADLGLSGPATIAGATRPSCVSPDKTTDVATKFASIAYQVCDTDDVVCDTSGLLAELESVVRLPFSRRQVREELDTLWQDIKLSEHVHTTSYTGSAETTAGRKVARSLVPGGADSGPTVSPASPSTSTSAPAGDGSWTAMKAPLPAGALSGEIRGVSCPSASECVAVGVDTYGNAENPQSGAILLTESQGSWTAVQAPAPGNALPADPGVDLSGVSCPSASYCVAVGEYSAAASGGSSSSQVMGLLLTWAGGSWTATQAPAPAGITMTGVSCPSTSYCVAVGWYLNTSGSYSYDEGVLLTDSSGTWTAADAPAPADAVSPASDDIPGSIVNGVSCVSSSFCMAVGTYASTTGYEPGLLLTYSGGTWTAAGAPLPSDAAAPGTNQDFTPGANLSSVSCSSTSFCAAAGYYLRDDRSDQGVLLTDTDGTWTAAGSPSAASPKPGWLNGISCWSENDCVAVGWFMDSDGDTQGSLVTDSGGSWTAGQVVPPSDASANPVVELMGASCLSATDCVAGGTYSPGGPLLLTESG